MFTRNGDLRLRRRRVERLRVDRSGGPSLAAPHVNPAKAIAPDLTAALYIPQPWGHFDLSAVLRPDLGLDRRRVLQPDLRRRRRPFRLRHQAGLVHARRMTSPSTSPAVTASAAYLNSSTNFAIETNFSVATRRATTAGANPASGILSGTTTECGGEIGYQHWWMDNLRSNFNFGINHHDINSRIIGAAQSAAANHQLEVGARQHHLEPGLVRRRRPRVLLGQSPGRRRRDRPARRNPAGSDQQDRDPLLVLTAQYKTTTRRPSWPAGFLFAPDIRSGTSFGEVASFPCDPS